jgi:hypothetical protein
MNHPIIVALLVGSFLGLNLASAHAGPCTKKIAQFEKAVRQSAKNPDAGPTAAQSVGAQLSHQPTPDSVKRAEAGAEANFATHLSRAKALDAKGDRAGCTRALAQARRLYSF